ncbi:MAG: hypothetical protein ACI9T7_003628 [Oleiphilaceae bacterium]|jgi:hypothetical protein
MMETKRTFILGLGHQKCGTSWLHKYLCQSDSFAESFTKEHHVWDRKDISLFKGKKIKLNNLTFLCNESYQRYHMENSNNYYFSYFDKLMSKNKIVTADITPSYSGLKSDRLEYIKKEFLARGIETKVVILVREPLSRIKSAVRFNLDRGNYSEGVSVNETDFETALNQYYKSKNCSIRTNYENIISEAKSVFSMESIYLGFYESMFEVAEIRRLSKFLQIDAKEEFASVIINKTRNAVSLTQSDLKVKAYYAGTYEYFYKNYPIAKDLWR